MTKKVRSRIREMGLSDLPDGRRLVEEGMKLSQSVTIGKTLFMEKYGVSSEREYKELRMKEREVMFAFQYGRYDLESLDADLRRIYDGVTQRGHRIDRYGFLLDCKMGLPEDRRNQLTREGGLELRGKEEWQALGHIVPIQPYIGDHIVSSPASIENLLDALSAGITSVGSFSQYFTYEYPMWDDHILRTANFIKAIGVIAGLKDKGVMLQTNMNGGFGSRFYYSASNVGWAMMEYYIVNDLIGAKLSPCFGNRAGDSISRMATVLCLDEIHKHKCTGAMVHSPKVTPGTNPKKSNPPASSVINDIVMQMHTPTGHAITPCAATNSDEIPTPEEIIQTQLTAARLKSRAARQYESTDFGKIEDRARTMIKNGRKFFNRILDAFADVVDVQDPFKLMYGLRLFGADNFENVFLEKASNT